MASNLLAMQSDEMVPGTTTPTHHETFFALRRDLRPLTSSAIREDLCARRIEWCWPYRKPHSADKLPHPKVPILEAERKDRRKRNKLISGPRNTAAQPPSMPIRTALRSYLAGKNNLADPTFNTHSCWDGAEQSRAPR